MWQYGSVRCSLKFISFILYGMHFLCAVSVTTARLCLVKVLTRSAARWLRPLFPGPFSGRLFQVHFPGLFSSPQGGTPKEAMNP